MILSYNCGKTNEVDTNMKTYTLIGKDGEGYKSLTPGLLGGHKKLKVYGRLDCPSAQRWIAKGHYVQYRVFFADEPTAIVAGYRPCATCMKERYALWKKAQNNAHNKEGARALYRTFFDDKENGLTLIQ